MAYPLLFHVETKNKRLSVCAQHLNELGNLLRDKNPFDFFPNDNQKMKKQLVCYVLVMLMLKS